jgi:deoxyadenosine/deoxycytidine kinase
MPFQYIAVEGPIGVGKSSLAERIADRLDATAVLEETDNPFLADFYAGRAGAALQAQLFYLLNRHRQLVGLQQGNLFSQTTVCDYLFDKDKIFAYLNLDDNELFIYQRLFDLLAKDIPAPISSSTCRRRVMCSSNGCARGRRIRSTKRSMSIPITFAN